MTLGTVLIVLGVLGQTGLNIFFTLQIAALTDRVNEDA